MDDRTYTAASRQLKGMRLERVELTIHGPERTMVEEMATAQVLTDLPRLKRANKAGCNIYLRPPRSLDHDLIFLDDLNLFTPERMKADGHTPAVTVESSPGSLQAWVRMGVPCPASVRHEIARELAALYGGDPGSVDPHQSGRLAGFTNRKPQHQGARGFPFVLLLTAPGAVAPAAPSLIQRAVAAAGRRAEADRATRIHLGDVERDLVAYFEKAHAIAPRGSDLSAIDWASVHRALASGRDPDDVAAALAQVSERKGRHHEDYAIRTVMNAVRHRSGSGDPSPF